MAESGWSSCFRPVPQLVRWSWPLTVANFGTELGTEPWSVSRRLNLVNIIHIDRWVNITNKAGEAGRWVGVMNKRSERVCEQISASGFFSIPRLIVGFEPATWLINCPEVGFDFCFPNNSKYTVFAMHVGLSHHQPSTLFEIILTQDCFQQVDRPVGAKSFS